MVETKKSLKGTKTEQNLLASFAGESQARNRYTFFASAAKKAGYEQIAEIFLETAENEKEHGKRFFKFLGGEATITAAYPSGKIGTTEENLAEAAAGERMEWTTLYQDAAGEADREGFPEVAQAFRHIAKVEEKHEARYRKLLSNINDGKVFKKEKKVQWKCRNCGYIHEGPEAPEQCPACLHPRAYYEVFVETY